MLTGVMPSRVGLRQRQGHCRAGRDPGAQPGPPVCAAGYETSYGGKLHTPMTLDQIGFDLLTTDEREGLAEKCVEFLHKKHEKPFLLVASFINPHDICYMAIRAYAEAQKRKGQSHR